MSLISRDSIIHHTGTVPLCSTIGAFVLDAAYVHPVGLPRFPRLTPVSG